jgi:hypothetical protein
MFPSAHFGEFASVLKICSVMNIGDRAMDQAIIRQPLTREAMVCA